MPSTAQVSEEIAQLEVRLKGLYALLPPKAVRDWDRQVGEASEAGSNMCVRREISLREAASAQLREAKQNADMAGKLAEFVQLVENNPEVARILELLPMVRR